MHKKLFAVGLAVLMILSMLACFVLPASAVNLNDREHYYVSTAAEWNQRLKEITGDWSGKTLHIEKDLDFSGVSPVQFDTFMGTLDGHGHTFKNLHIEAGGFFSGAEDSSLIKTLGGTIRNLNLDSSCSFTNKYSTISGTAVIIGSFAAKTENGAMIYNCSSKAAVNVSNTNRAKYVGGFVGDASEGLTIDGCYYDGSYTPAGSYGALVGNGSPNVYNTIVMNSTDAHCKAANNSYASVTAENALATGWTVNANYVATTNPRIYFSADQSSNLIRTSAKEERIVKVTTIKDGVSAKNYYGPRLENYSDEKKEYPIFSTQMQITPETVDGKTIEVIGAQFENGIIYLDYQDVLVNYVDNTTDDYKFNQAKAQLQELVDAYSAMDSKYFTNWSAKQNWLASAKHTLNTATKASQLQTVISGEAALADGVASLTYPNYPSIKDYNIYKHIASLKDYAVGSAEEWLAAVEMSDFVHNDKAVNFTDITIHLTKNINMGNAAMLPLCYGDICDANFNGHDFTFENVNIQVNAPVGPVGLIANLGKTKARTVYNLGIGSGIIHTDGIPRYKLSWSITDGGNKTGGICGRTHRNGAIFRKCWFGGEVSSSNRDSTAPIIADARHSVTLDSCFNIGKSNGTGISGYGQNSEMVYNSFSGATSGAAVNISMIILGNDPNRMSDPDEICAKFDEHFKNVYSVSAPLSLSHISSDATQAAIEKQAGATWNARYRVMSNAAAAWMVMENYQQALGSGERIYFTLDEKGNVAFGTEENRIRRITMKYTDAQNQEHIRYLYTTAGSTITLACPDEYETNGNNRIENEFYLYNVYRLDGKPASEKTVIKGDQLTLGNEDITVLAGKNIRRGDVDGSGVLDLRDALTIVQKMVKGGTLNEMVADVDSNGVINLTDALMMVREWLKGNKGEIFNSSLPTAKRDDYIKVCSYNIKNCYYDPFATVISNGVEIDAPYDSGKPMGRKEELVAELAKINADIIGLQEVSINDDRSGNKHQLEELANALSNETGKEYNYQHFLTLPYEGSSVNGYGHGIMTIYDILDYGEVRFAGLCKEDGTRFDAWEPRGFGWYDLDIDPEDGKEYIKGKDIRFYNCHLAEMTYDQLQFMATYMEKDIEEGHLVVCTGDFNLQAFDMKGAFNVDKLTALNGGDQFNSYRTTTSDGSSMIDNILVSDNLDYYWNEGMQTGVFYSDTIYVDKDLKDGDTIERSATASDHLAIWTYIKNPAK